MPLYRFPAIDSLVHMRGTKLPPACLARLGLREARERNPMCWRPSAFLCDWPAGGGRTCDLPLCEAHAHQVGKNRHYCPEHHRDHLDQQGQRGLFTGLVKA